MTDDTPRVDREGIHIERDLADQLAIEEDLDANIERQYRFPQPSRRRIAAWVYVVAGAASAFAFEGGWMVGLGFAGLAVWQLLASWPLAVDESEAMTTAAAAVDFPVGHSAASIRFHGWRSRPRWSVVLYSAAEPPDRRALVVVDAVTSDIVETPYIEDIVPV